MKDDGSSVNEFLQLLAAAMLDAAKDGNCTQLQSVITPPGGRATMVRIVVIPEEMTLVRGAPSEKFRRPE